CTSHITPYQPKQREYVPRPAQGDPVVDAPPPEGSLFSQRSWVADLVRDQRARCPGDLVVVRVVENAIAERGASTDLKRESENEAAIEAFFGLLEQYQDTNPTFDPSAIISSTLSR